MKNFLYNIAPAVVAVLLAAALVGLIALCINGMYAEEARWAEFAAAHDCKVTGRMSGDVVSGTSSNGSVIVASTPDKTAYTCNDGVTYWR